VAAVANSDTALSAIGASLGFASPAQFSRFFRDHVSVAPRDFRAVVRQTHGAAD
jgi:AraC-like DNA-binding protein